MRHENDSRQIVIYFGKIALAHMNPHARKASLIDQLINRIGN